MTDLKQSIREINELIDVVVTIRLCHILHPKSNSALRKCAKAIGKRGEEAFTKRVCKELSHSSNVISDLVTIQTKLL